MKKNYILFLLASVFAWTANAQITLTQSVDNATIDDMAGGVACWAAGVSYADNSFFRVYNLADFGVTDDFGITSVEYGQSSANEGTIITLNIYTVASDDLTADWDTRALAGTAIHTSSATDDSSLVSVALTATIPAGSTIVFEVFVAEHPDDMDPGTPVDSYFPGINSAGENDDSYIMAAACGLTAPATLTSIGQTDQYVMNVIGDVLSVDEFSLENSVTIFPNPTSDIITIDAVNSITVNSLELYNIVGKQVIKTTNVSTLDLEQLSAGVYMLRVMTDSGTLTKKVIRN